jgi:L-fuconolactonase
MIDAHVHLWQIGRNGCTWPTPDLAPIHRDFALEELGEVIASARVRGAILVQSQEDPADTRWLLDLAADPRIMAVIGWVDLTAHDAVPQIRALAREPKLRGLRPMLQGGRIDWYDPALDPALCAMAELGLAFDALVRPRHLAALGRMAAAHPHLRIVIDHAAKPDMADLDPWRDAMAAVAQHANVACKLSGLLTEPGLEHVGAIRPVFDRLWNCFGPDRLIWGSDWPVVTLAADYASWLDRALALVPAQHHDAVFGGNAARIYGLANAGA